MVKEFIVGSKYRYVNGAFLGEYFTVLSVFAIGEETATLKVRHFNGQENVSGHYFHLHEDHPFNPKKSEITANCYHCGSQLDTDESGDKVRVKSSHTCKIATEFKVGGKYKYRHKEAVKNWNDSMDYMITSPSLTIKSMGKPNESGGARVSFNEDPQQEDWFIRPSDFWEIDSVVPVSVLKQKAPEHITMTFHANTTDTFFQEGSKSTLSLIKPNIANLL